MIFAMLLAGLSAILAVSAASAPVVKSEAPLRPLTALTLALPAPADPRLSAFVARAIEVHRAAAGAPSARGAAPSAEEIPPTALLETALSQALAGLDPDAIAAMSPDDVSAVAARVWDSAAAAVRPGDGVTPPRYGKLHVALEYYLKEKGFSLALDAMNFAREKHSGTRRDGLTPEFQHQVEIALFLTTLKDVPDLETVLTVALLHDVVEDYPVRREEIVARFGAVVEDSVWRLTKVYDGKHKPYDEYFAAIAVDPVASLVKGADRVHNLQSMVGVFRIEKQREYAAEAETWFLPMLKKARLRFPYQAAAYLNVEHMIKSQLRLIHAFLDASAAPDPRARFKELEKALAAKAPKADVDVDVERRYVFANRERVPDPDAFFGGLVAALREAGVSVLDTTFGVPSGRLEAYNVVDEAAAARVAAELGPDASYAAMTAEQRARLLFEPFARRLEDQIGPALLHVDHHYSFRLLSSASTTPLMVDFLRHLHATGRVALIERLQGGFAVLDHTDTDITLSNLALRRGHDLSFLDAVGDILKDAALFNDYVKAAGPQAITLYNVAAAVERRLGEGVLKYHEAFDLLAAAARWAAGGPESAALRELHEDGVAEYTQELAALRSMFAAGVREGSAAAARPGEIVRDGAALVLYMADGATEVSSASALRYLQEERPELLEGARALVTTNAKGDRRFFKMRAFLDKDGRFLDLADKDHGVYAALNERSGPRGERYRSSGRSFAGGVSKNGFAKLDGPATAAVLGDVAAAVTRAALTQSLSR